MRAISFRVAAALLCLAGSAQAQASAGRTHALTTILAVPDGFAMMCRTPTVVLHKPVPGGSVVREFKFGHTVDGFPEFPREVTVAFDSLGDPRLMVDAVILGPPPHTTMAVMSRVAADSVAGLYLETKLDSADLIRLFEVARRDGAAAAEAAMPAPEQRDLTADEHAQARRFASWLWKRRCDR